jgi:hypothetical protein
MGRRHAIIVSTGDIKRDELADALLGQGVSSNDLTILTGARATKTAIESRLRKAAAQLAPTDSLLIFWTGPVVGEAGQNTLPVADSQPDDLVPTSVALADLLDALGRPSSGPGCLFLDPLEPGLAEEELNEFAEAAENAVCFTACSAGEVSEGDVWMGLVAEALAGRAADLTAAPGTITAGSLQADLEQELSRALRGLLAEPAPQTPRRFGSPGDGAVIWELAPASAAPPKPPVDLDRLRRTVLRSETSQKVKTLSGFQKTHRVPEMANAWADRFVGKIAQADIRADIDDIYDALRQHMGFKRKDLEASAERDGTGFIRTPAFDYTVTVRVDPDDPESVIWRREVGQIRDPRRVRSEAFRAVFGDTFDRLVFEFAEPLDVVAFVDRIEDAEPPGVSVRVASDGSNCDVMLDGFKGAVRIDANVLRIEGSSAAQPDGLVGQFFDFLQRFGESAASSAPLPLDGGKT